MKLELQIVEFFKHLNELNVDISKKTNKSLIEEYYKNIGFTQDSSLTDWFSGLADKRYRPYNQVEKAIKTARNYELKWKRNIN